MLGLVPSNMFISNFLRNQFRYISFWQINLDTCLLCIQCSNDLIIISWYKNHIFYYYFWTTNHIICSIYLFKEHVHYDNALGVTEGSYLLVGPDLLYIWRTHKKINRIRSNIFLKNNKIIIKTPMKITALILSKILYLQNCKSQHI